MYKKVASLSGRSASPGRKASDTAVRPRELFPVPPASTEPGWGWGPGPRPWNRAGVAQRKHRTGWGWAAESSAWAPVTLSRDHPAQPQPGSRGLALPVGSTCL